MSVSYSPETIKNRLSSVESRQNWTYIDPPTTFSYEMWDLFLSILGEGEYEIISQTTTINWIRGSLLISPKAMENMKKHMSK